MLARIRSWIVPSLADEDLNRRAALLNLMTLLALVLALVTNGALIVTTLLAGQTSGLILAIVTVAVCLVWVGVIYTLSHRGHVAAACHVLLWGGTAIALASNLTDPNSGLTDPVWYLFPVIVVAASLLLGTRWGVIFAVVESTLYLFSALGEWLHYIPRAVPRPPDNIPYAVAMTGGALLALSALGWLFGSGLERALQRARQQAAELAEAKGRLESAQAYLEQTVERTVAQYTAFAQRVAAGDLTSRLDLPAGNQNPLASLGENLNVMVESLYHVSQQVHGAVGELTKVSAGIQAVCSQQSSGAGEQSAAITQATSTIAEVRTITEQTAARAQGVATIARQTAEVSAAGQQAVAGTVAGMGQVKEQVGSIASQIVALAEQTRTIGEIITTVNEIAVRSKLLALNAAVEAARAGEAGKGFAVVAGEMRGLADQSRVATEQVRAILSEIQKGVDAAVMATEEGVRRTDAGVRLTGEAGGAIRQLAEGVTASAQSAAQIAAAAGQQLVGVEQIALAMEHIHQVTAENLSSTQQSKQAGAELERLATRLHEIVAQYRL